MFCVLTLPPSPHYVLHCRSLNILWYYAEIIQVCFLHISIIFRLWRDDRKNTNSETKKAQFATTKSPHGQVTGANCVSLPQHDARPSHRQLHPTLVVAFPGWLSLQESAAFLKSISGRIFLLNRCFAPKDLVPFFNDLRSFQSLVALNENGIFKRMFCIYLTTPKIIGYFRSYQRPFLMGLKAVRESNLPFNST